MDEILDKIQNVRIIKKPEIEPEESSKDALTQLLNSPDSSASPDIAFDENFNATEDSEIEPSQKLDETAESPENSEVAEYDESRDIELQEVLKVGFIFLVK